MISIVIPYEGLGKLGNTEASAGHATVMSSRGAGAHLVRAGATLNPIPYPPNVDPTQKTSPYIIIPHPPTSFIFNFT